MVAAAVDGADDKLLHQKTIDIPFRTSSIGIENNLHWTIPSVSIEIFTTRRFSEPTQNYPNRLLFLSLSVFPLKPIQPVQCCRSNQLFMTRRGWNCGQRSLTTEWVDCVNATRIGLLYYEHPVRYCNCCCCYWEVVNALGADKCQLGVPSELQIGLNYCQFIITASNNKFLRPPMQRLDQMQLQVKKAGCCNFRFGSQALEDQPISTCVWGWKWPGMWMEWIFVHGQRDTE